MVNKTLGNHFESELCDILSRNGYWAHNMACNRDGQPADVIAVRGDVAHLIDCKVCSHDTFPLSRIEDNQEGSMTVWEQSGNTSCLFAMKLSDNQVYMVSFDELILARLYGGKIYPAECIRKSPTLEDWMENQP